MTERRRRESARRRRLRRSAALAAAGFALLAATLVAPPAPRLLWNKSASAPVGLYFISPDKVARPGDMVIARVPASWRALAAGRRYIPANVPLVKQVAAASGDRVCAAGDRIFVNARAVARRLEHDARGRTMHWWQGCVTLRSGELFLLMGRPGSFDGRYFGPTASSEVIGRAKLLWRA